MAHKQKRCLSIPGATKERFVSTFLVITFSVCSRPGNEAEFSPASESGNVKKSFGNKGRERAAPNV